LNFEAFSAFPPIKNQKSKFKNPSLILSLNSQLPPLTSAAD